jgi:hypothetical protein
VKRHREHVGQHEREPLDRAERVQHDLQRDPDRVHQQDSGSRPAINSSR